MPYQFLSYLNHAKLTLIGFGSHWILRYHAIIRNLGYKIHNEKNRLWDRSAAKEATILSCVGQAWYLIYENIFLRSFDRKHIANQCALFCASNILSQKSCKKNYLWIIFMFLLSKVNLCRSWIASLPWWFWPTHTNNRHGCLTLWTFKNRFGTTNSCF